MDCVARIGTLECEFKNLVFLFFAKRSGTWDPKPRTAPTTMQLIYKHQELNYTKLLFGREWQLEL